MTNTHMKTLFVLHRPCVGAIERLQKVLGPDFVVVQVGEALVGRRDLKAAIITAPYDHTNDKYLAQVDQYISDIRLRLDGAPLIRL